MNFNRLQITVVLGVAVFIWFIILLIQGTSITYDHLAPFSAVVSVLVILSLLLEYFLWRKIWMQKWFVSIPDLRGTWEVEIISDWVDPATGEVALPIKAYMGVKQSMSKLQMHLMTPESESWLIAHSVCESQSGHGYQIAGVYTNKPSVSLRNGRSSIHLGALLLDTHGEMEIYPEKMSGEYWTDRKTTGIISLSNRKNKFFTNYIDANIHFE